MGCRVVLEHFFSLIHGSFFLLWPKRKSYREENSELSSTGVLSYRYKWYFLCRIWWFDFQFPLLYPIILIPKTIGNKKRDCALGCARGINTTWENLQIEKQKSVRWAERTPSWFVLFSNLQIFSGGVYPPSAASRTISFSISNSFWY